VNCKLGIPAHPHMPLACLAGIYCHRFQYHRDTRAEADDLLACILRKHTPVELCEICGPHAATIEVREIQCYYGGSAIFTSGFDQRRLGADMLVDGE